MSKIDLLHFHYTSCVDSDMDLVDQCLIAHINTTYIPLCYATYIGHEVTVQKLLQSQVDVTTKKDIGLALRLAAMNGYETIVRLLLGAKADLHSRWNGRTALRQAAINGHSKIVQLVLEAKAEINEMSFGGTTLCQAAENGMRLSYAYY